MSQKWNASQYVNHASFVAEHGSSVVGLLSPKSGERILDLGCGDGALTEEIQNIGAIVRTIDITNSSIVPAQKSVPPLDSQEAG